jgi:hypothetical protein
VVPIAPRYHDAILELADTLDDRRVPMAETCRRVGAAAEALGLFRPSYAHLRRFLVAKRAAENAERERREARRKLAEDAIAGLIAGRVLQPYHQLRELLDD